VLKFQTVEEKVSNTNANRLTARQQRLLLRAVVGSLVISAALAAPHAAAQTPSADARDRYKEVVTKYPYPADPATPFLRVLVKAADLHRDGLIKSSDDTFEITFEAERHRDGSIHDLRVTSVAAVNGLWPSLMRELIEAVSRSRVLAPLEDVERLSFTLRLDDRRGAFAGLNFEARSSEHAEQLKNAYATLLQLAAARAQGRPEEALFRGANVTANGKQFALTLQMPRERLGNLLRQSLAQP
jgi:hypothetical protein